MVHGADGAQFRVRSIRREVTSDDDDDEGGDELMNQRQGHWNQLDHPFTQFLRGNNEFNNFEFEVVESEVQEDGQVLLVVQEREGDAMSQNGDQDDDQWPDNLEANQDETQCQNEEHACAICLTRSNTKVCIGVIFETWRAL